MAVIGHHICVNTMVQKWDFELLHSSRFVLDCCAAGVYKKLVYKKLCVVLWVIGACGACVCRVCGCVRVGVQVVVWVGSQNVSGWVNG